MRERSDVVRVRCAPDEKAAWVAAAGGAGGADSLSSWVRARLNGAVLSERVGLAEPEMVADASSVGSPRSESSAFKAPEGPRGFKSGGADPKVKKYPGKKRGS